MTRDLTASVHTPHISGSLSWEDSPGICILQKIWGAPQGEKKKTQTRTSTIVLNSHLVFLIPQGDISLVRNSLVLIWLYPLPTPTDLPFNKEGLPVERLVGTVGKTEITLFFTISILW